MRTLGAHWPEYLIEAGGLGLFMAAAVTFAVLFQHPASPLAVAMPGRGLLTSLERLPMGLTMGLTAAALIYSPLGRRSGAHMNPAVTLAFFRLGRISAIDALAYTAAQCGGGIAGVGVTTVVLADLPAHQAVNYVATMPGPSGAPVAFASEAIISALLMLVVLATSASRCLSRWTGAAAAALVALFIVLEAPLSGMSMNPARTLASAAFTDSAGLWIYFTAPPLGMLTAAELFVRLGAARRVLCAKLHHGRSDGATRHCIFSCGHMETSA